VWGRLDEPLASRLAELWPEAGTGVVCVLYDDDGGLAGANAVHAADVDLVAGRRFWTYREHLVPGAEDARPALLAQAFTALEAQFEPGGNGPVGVCLLLTDPAAMAERPEAEWSDPRMLYAGYDADGAQVRIGYFAGATV